MEGDNDFLFACVCMPPFGPHATRPDIPTQVHVIFPLPSNAVHLAYKLEVPLQAGPAQAVFKVEDEGDMADRSTLAPAGTFSAAALCPARSLPMQSG